MTDGPRWGHALAGMAVGQAWALLRGPGWGSQGNQSTEANESLGGDTHFKSVHNIPILKNHLTATLSRVLIPLVLTGMKNRVSEGAY